jgi:TonB family protein
VTDPVVVQRASAVLPPSAKIGPDGADVVLFVTVDPEGRVSGAEVSQSGGSEIDAAAVTAVLRWTFRAATRDGRPVASRIRVPFHVAPPAAAADSGSAPAVEPSPLESPAPPKAVAPVASSATPAPGSAAPSAPPRGAAPDEVTVVGRAQAPSRGTSDFALRVGELRHIPRQNASELLKLAPGILLTNEGGDGHADQVFLRGYDAREGQDIEFTVGGVPINESGNLHGDGYADTHFIIPELVQSLRVVEGPFDPRQGNYAVAGSADYELGLDRRGLTGAYTLGSFGTDRALLLWGPKHQSAGTFAGAELYRTDGYGRNRDARRGSAMGQYEGALGADTRYRLTATAYSTSYRSAGLLRDDDYQAGRVGFYDTYDVGLGGESSRYSLAGEVESHRGGTTTHAQVFATLRDMRLRENFTGFLLDVQEPWQTPHAQRGDMLDLDVSEATLGSRGFGRHRFTVGGQPQDLEVGYFARGDAVGNTERRIEASTGQPYRTDTDNEAWLGDLGLYGDLSLRAAKWLSVRGGPRADLLTFDVKDKCAGQGVAPPSQPSPPGDAPCARDREPTARRTTASTTVMPRVSVVLGPVRHFSFTASYGAGVRSVDPTYVTQGVTTAFASVRAVEGGVIYTGQVRDVEISARSVLFHSALDRELVFDERVGRSVLGGGTTRNGWVGVARLTGQHFDEAANVALVRSTYDDTHLLVTYVPDVVVRSDTAFFAPLPWRLGGAPVRGTLATGITYVGRRALPYGQRSDEILTLDASASLRWRPLELRLAATNLLDRQYRLGEYSYASDFHSQPAPTLVPMRAFAAGAPRGLFVTFSVTLGGDDAN